MSFPACQTGAHLCGRHPGVQRAQVLRAAHRGGRHRHHRDAEQRALQQPLRLLEQTRPLRGHPLLHHHALQHPHRRQGPEGLQVSNVEKDIFS